MHNNTHTRNGINSSVHPKKRIRVACDNCRRKKIKCDGKYPCGNCKQAKEGNCNYKERPEKKLKPSSEQRLPKRVSNSKTIELLGSRLSKLEDVIVTLTEKLDNVKSPSNLKRSVEIDNKNVQYNYTNSNSPSNVDYATSENTDEDDDLVSNNVEKANSQSHTKSKSILSSVKFEQYFGMHSIFGIFSNKSLEWIEKTLGPDDSHLINPVKNIPLVIESRMKSFSLKWIDPPHIDVKGIKRLLEKPFPENSRLVFDLIDTYYDMFAMGNVLCDAKYIRKLFERYYKPVDKRFKISELMMMSMVLALSIRAKLDKDIACSHITTPNSVSIVETPKSIQSISNDELLSLQDEFFENSIFYYNRISVFGEGIETIQAILLLIIYIETSYILSHVNYILTSVAIRFAQGIGLHRSESYESFPVEEIDKRRKIWWICQYLDMEICFRSGKPPLINSLDSSFNSDFDLNGKLSPHTLFPSLSGVDQDPSRLAHKVLGALNVQPFTDMFSHYCHYILISLTNIRAKSYNRLFIASAQTKSFESLSNALDDLNNELFKLAELMIVDVRPRFCNDPEFRYLPHLFDTKKKEIILEIQLLYFSQLMIINRIPSIIGVPEIEGNEKALKFRNIALNSARTVLVLSRQIDESILISFSNWLIFFPLSAFLSLAAACLNHPNSPETYDDINLLIDCSMKFSLNQNPLPAGSSSRLKIFYQKELITGLVYKSMLRIVIRVFESKTSFKILENNEQLKNHLDSTQKLFPEIFKDTAEFNSKVSTIFEASCFARQSDIQINSEASPFESSQLNHSSNDVSNTTPANNRTTNNRIKLINSETNTQYVNNPYADSPSFNPSLSNILHPSVFSETPYQNQHQFQPYSNQQSNDGLDDIWSSYFNDDGISSILGSQMNNMPNFFFDNNFGV